MEFKASYKIIHSKKNDKDYPVIVIKLTDNYEKTVFLSDVEAELMRLAFAKGGQH